MRLARSGALVIALMGCDPAPRVENSVPSASAEASNQPQDRRYPSPAWAAIRDDTAKGPAVGGVTAVSRTLLARITSSDEIGLAVRFESEAADKQVLDFSATLGGLEFHLTGPGGDTKILRLAATPAANDVAPLGGRAHVIHLGDEGLRHIGVVTPWAEPDPHLLEKPGSYRLKLKGALALREDAGAGVAFETAEHTVELTPMGRDALPLADLEGIAARFVEKVERLDAPPRRSAEVIDDVQHNRLFRFVARRVGPTTVFVDIAMSPNGALMGARSFNHFSCVAYGTPIATATGSEPVEELAVGDVLLSYDPERHATTTARVLRIQPTRADRLFAIGDLHVTGEHPIHHEGDWRAAHTLGTPVHGDARVFDITVESPHTYFAAGVLVHNKASPVGPPPGPWQGMFTRPLQ